MNKISQNYFKMTEHKLSEDGMIVKIHKTEEWWIEIR